MAVITVLAVLTLVSMRAIASDARLSSAKNSVMASLDNARALAIKHNTLVLVAFRPRQEGAADVAVDAVLCRWTGESFGNGSWVIDRFVPVQGATVRTLPKGIKVAAPDYRVGRDDIWLTQAHLPAVAATNEVPGALIGVMYGPDGSTLTANPQSDSTLTWVDFGYAPADGPRVHLNSTDYVPTNIAILSLAYFEQSTEQDEPFVTFAPFVAVYDDHEARQRTVGDWSILVNYEADLTGPLGYITQSTDRIHFNRYTGVAMK